MNRHWLVLALLLSVGINAGLIAGKLLWDRPAPVEDSVQPAAEESAPDQQPATAEQGDVPVRAMPPRLRQGIERMADELQLEGESRDRFFEIQRHFFAATFEAEARRRRTEHLLRRELLETDPDPGRAEARLSELITAHRDLEQAFLDNYFSTHELLGPEQKRLFLRLMRRVRQVREEIQQHKRPQRPFRSREWVDRRRPASPRPE
ncbi:MAG: hypothetical protein MI919_42885 [Holophagales bacterium]|nr:hypothetical protein [Holophagales bacterium]